MLRAQTAMSAGLRAVRSGPATLVWLLVLIQLFAFFPGSTAHAHPQLILPTPPGEPWRIIQGYGCGTHNAWDFYSLDLASAGGRTYDAPVRAAADGRFYVWDGGSGTLILDHGGGFYTMYTHMARNFVGSGATVARGTVIGLVGDRGTRGTPHLHFTAFTSAGGFRGQRSVPLSFADGYELPGGKGCNQYGGKVMTAKGDLLGATPAIEFRGGVEPGRWYNQDMRLEFETVAAWGGFSQSWNRDPGGEKAFFPQSFAGYATLAENGEGLHTFYVRAWGVNGLQVLSSFGPVGYDVTPPQAVLPLAPTAAPEGAGFTLQWSPAADSGSGIAGYKFYLGADPGGQSDAYSEHPQIDVPPLGAGGYLLRVQPIDFAGNAGPWATVGEILVGQ